MCKKRSDPERTPFELVTSYRPQGDQPQAITQLVKGVQEGENNQVLMGVTGSGKTFTMANVIQALQRPTLIMAPNKILAAQLYGEMKSFFPHNHVEYFVSYYDYYRPEAYIPKSDLFIEKESSINERIERLRHSATRSLLESRDVVVVASVSCIYGLGDVESYREMCMELEVGQSYPFGELFLQWQRLQYRRNDYEFVRGNFRVKGDSVDLFPSHYDSRAWSFSFFDEELEAIHEINPLTGEVERSLERVTIFPNSHYVVPGKTISQAAKGIEKELAERLVEFEREGKLVERQRLKERVTFDLEMLRSTGYCNGVENYSRYLTGRPPGSPPPTLFEYLPKDSLLLVDESHVAVPQVRGMFLGDQARKKTLAEYGFRLPSCKDNRPLSFEEWDQCRPQTIFISATPGPWELEKTQGVFVEQIVRPTGILDPLVELHPSENQVDHLIQACREVKQDGGRVFVTTLTKKMAEDLTKYLWEAGINVRYMHSDIDALERIEILQDLREGVFQVLVGINLLREGLDVPECQLVAILDGDKEGYLRSKTSLIQTMGRAARNVKGRVVIYGDRYTQSIAGAIEETSRRRKIQEAHNQTHGLSPRPTAVSSKKILSDQDMSSMLGNKPKASRHNRHEQGTKTHPSLDEASGIEPGARIQQLEERMLKAAENLDFEQAALLRDQIASLKKKTD